MIKTSERLQETETFLNILYKNIIEDQIEYESENFCLCSCTGWGKKPVKAKNFRTVGFYQTVDDILKEIEKNLDRDIWMQIATGNGKSRNKIDTTYAHAFIIEIDFKNLKDHKEIEELCFKINELQPGLIINSGNGVHVYFLLTEPYQLTPETRDKFEVHGSRLRMVMENTIKPYLKDGQRLDSIQDVARVLRLPGTRNNKDSKNPKPVTLLHQNSEQRYGFDEICQTIDKLCAKWKTKPQGDVQPLNHVNGSKEYKVRFEHLMKTLDLHEGLRVSDNLIDDMATRFPDREKPGFLKAFTGEKTFDNDNSASGGDFSIINYAVRYGCDDQTTLALVIHSRVVRGKDLDIDNLQKQARSIAAVQTDPKVKVDPKHLSLSFIKKCFDSGQEGDGDLYFELNKDKFRYDNKNIKGNVKRKWFAWTGSFWQLDDRQYLNAVSLLIPEYQHYLFSIRKEIKKQNPEENKTEIKTLKKLIESINKRINSIKRVNVKKDIVENAVIRHSEFLNIQWDNNINLLPFLNGVYNLEKFKFEESKRENFNQKVLPYNYDPDAECPAFNKIINDQFGEHAALAMNHGEPLSQQQKDDVKNMKDYVQILNGLCLPGDNQQQIWVINHGPEGRNGKSKIYEALKVTMGDFGSPMADKLIMKTKYEADHTDALQGLQGMRLTINSDSRGELSTSKVSRYTGGDGYFGRKMFEDGSAQAAPTFLMFLQVNKRPVTDADDADADYFWERTQLVTWKHRFLNKPDPLKPWEHERDVTIGNKVNLEYQGIMNWLIAGYKKYVEAGRKINQPKSVQKALAEYRFSFDGLSEFNEYYAIKTPGAAFSIKEAHEIYMAFAEELSVSNPIRNSIVFARQLLKRFDLKKTEKNKTKVPTFGTAALQPTEDEYGKKIDTRCPCFLEIVFSPDF